MGPLVKAPGKKVTKYGNLGGKRCLQINGLCAVHLKIGTKLKSHEALLQRTKWEACVCVCYASVTKTSKYFLSSIFYTDVTCSRLDRVLIRC